MRCLLPGLLPLVPLAANTHTASHSLSLSQLTHNTNLSWVPGMWPWSARMVAVVVVAWLGLQAARGGRGGCGSARRLVAY